MDSAILDKKAYIPALIGAAVSLLLLRSGLLSFFFLVPMGFIACRHEYRIAWAASLFAILGNMVMSFRTASSHGVPLAATTWNLLFFTAMVLIFAWITVPPPDFAERVPLSIRFVTGSCFGALVFIAFFLRLLASPWFPEYVANLVNTLASQNALFEIISTETFLQGMKNVILRGGSLVTCVFMFALCRQLSFILALLIPRKKRKVEGANSEETGSAGRNSLQMSFQKINSLMAFRVHPTLIWVFSSSLPLVVLTRMAGLEIPEIILWNVLVLCVILYLAQGLGILQFFLSRTTVSPFLRLLFLVFLFILLFSPLLNMILLTGFVLLGIAENWVPFRVPKQNSPPSTPESGQ